MVFELIYGDQRYLIELQHFDKEKDKMEVFAIQYDGDEKHDEEYEIKMYQEEGENLKRIKVTDLSKEFLDWMGKELRNVMPASFFANPYFDELMIFYGSKVLTSKDRFVPVSCSACDRKDLYEKKGKDNKADYIEDIRTKLRNNPNPAWPFKGRLQIQFSVSDTLSRLNVIDLDNLAKSILDSLQGVVFENDAQIDALVATKDYTQGLIANIIAIKELAIDERPKFQEFLFSGNYKTWKDERNRKQADGRPTRFVTF